MPTIAEQLTQLTQDRDDLVDNLTTKGITGLTGDETFTELVPEVLNIPSGGGTIEVEEKDVNFYDYDGTLVYSYTASEFANLTEMPENPSHDGLTAQGWNWSLSNAKSYVAECGVLDIGQTYLPTDGKTKIVIELTNERKSPTMSLILLANSEVNIDWGDNTSVDNISRTSYGVVHTQHNYLNGGKYIISIEVVSGTIRPSGDSSTGCKLLWANNNPSYLYNYIYQCAIKEIYLGENFEAQDYAFNELKQLKKITLNKKSYTTYSGLPGFQNNYNLKCVIFPRELKYVGVNFPNCYLLERTIPSDESTYYSLNTQYLNNLKKINVPNSDVGYLIRTNYSIQELIIPSGVTSISNGAINSAYCLIKIIFKGNITQIANSSINATNILKTVDFRNCTNVPTLGTNNFTDLPSDCQIIVPDSLYDDWIADTNWSSLSSYIVKASEV